MGLAGGREKNASKNPTAVRPDVSATDWQVIHSRLQFVMYPYLTKNGKQMLVFLTHFRATSILIYRSKSYKSAL